MWEDDHALYPKETNVGGIGLIVRPLGTTKRIGMYAKESVVYAPLKPECF
jgi:hypothetical protein